VLLLAGQASVVDDAGADDVDDALVVLLWEVVLVDSVVELPLVDVVLTLDVEEVAVLLLVVNEELELVVLVEDETLVDEPPFWMSGMLVGELFVSTLNGSPKYSSSTWRVLIYARSVSARPFITRTLLTKLVLPRYPSMFDWPINCIVVVSSRLRILMSFVTPA
jgi:hypothetical protein